jgi:hypothetical protein
VRLNDPPLHRYADEMKRYGVFEDGQGPPESNPQLLKDDDDDPEMAMDFANTWHHETSKPVVVWDSVERKVVYRLPKS